MSLSVDIPAMVGVASAAAEAAGDEIRASFLALPAAHALPKGRYDVLLGIDEQAEAIISRHLTSSFPDVPIYSEERTEKPSWSEEIMWVVDPLDGSNNFLTGIPHLGVSIALRIEGRLTFGVIYDPILGDVFVAVDGEASTKNGIGFQVQNDTPLDRATVSLVSNYAQSSRAVEDEVYHQLRKQVRRVVSLWAPGVDLVRIAEGKLDGMICMEANYYDVCSGLIISQRAGVTIVGLDGAEVDPRDIDPQKPVSFAAAANRRLAFALAGMQTV